ncbi:hypothetical protein JTE90_009459 [Oedothorax gibbosus]|uniref:C2H2-type domain-containing protein n=1 Tax=Oedothorax gibbosus TaxID=931172 RepID=A0AAV6VSH8_9ARAC|nr:hypothetical protein JTE90_009459 [Oedothorax gibbosus]
MQGQTSHVLLRSMDSTTNSFPTVKVYRCPMCSYTAFKPSHIRQHSVVHTGERPYKCTICNKSFTQKDYFEGVQRTTNSNLHLSTMSNQPGIKVYSCTMCSYSSVYSCHVKQHSVVHTGERPYKCTVCNKRFAQKSSVKTHMLLHTGHKPFKCSLCHREFTQKKTLKIHMLTMQASSLKRVNKIFKVSATQHTSNILQVSKYTVVTCVLTPPTSHDYAGIQFQTSQQNLQSISNTANHQYPPGVKVYSCNMCSYTSHKSWCMKQHSVVHTGERRHKCTICKYAAATPSNTSLLTPKPRNPFIYSHLVTKYCLRMCKRQQDSNHKQLPSLCLVGVQSTNGTDLHLKLKSPINASKQVYLIHPFFQAA